MKVVLPGGSGFLGQSLAGYLENQGYDLVILTRTPRPGRFRQVAWDGRTVGEWCQELEGATAVINFTGKSVNCRYTPENRREIVASRVDSVRVVGEAIKLCDQPPPIFLQSGSLAIYGDSSVELDESGPLGSGFSAEVCRRWEEAFFGLELVGTRQAMFRIGFVLGQEGGALAMLAGLTRAFLGGTVGQGRQWISWIHIDDFNRILRQAVEQPWEGIYNVTGPTPVTNAKFMATLRQVLKRPWTPPAPAPFVRLGSWLLGTEAELALTGRRCLPARVLEESYQFQYWELERALADIFQSGP